MKRKEITVLVTAAGNVFMPGTLDCLRNNGERTIRMIGADMNEDPTILQMCDAAYQVPGCTDPSYVDVLLDICRKESVDILLPIMSAELEALSSQKSRFTEIGTIVSVSEPAALSVANHKRKLFDYLKESGIPCAGYHAVHSTEELQKSAALLGYPDRKVCVKTVNGSGSRGFRVLSESVHRYDLFLHEKPSAGILTLDEMVSILKEGETFPDLLVMEYLPGTEHSVDLLADWGRVLISCSRKALRMENSIMLDAVIEDAPEITALCARVTEGLGLDGNIGFDVREREDGTPVIMECNPRITAGVPYFALAGVNLPYLCIKKILGEELPESTPEYGRVIRRRWMEMIV